MNNPNNTPVETHEELDTSVVEQTGNDINNLTEAADDVSKALVTLESIAAAIESAPVLSALEAKVANATIARIDAQFELPTRSVGLESATDPRKAALEDLSSKIETFKKTIGAIIEKIIQLVKNFWEWLTLNSKNIRKRLQTLQDGVKGQHGKVEIAVNGSFKALTSENSLSYDSINDVAAQLHGLMPVTEKFMRSTSPRNIDTHVDGQGFVALRRASEQLKAFSERDGVYTLYENIGGRTLKIVFDPEIITKAISGELSTKPPYQAVISTAEKQTDLPSSVTMDEKQVGELLQGSLAVLDMVNKHFDVIRGSVKDIKFEERFVETSAQRDTKIAVLRAYSQTFNVFIDGVFTQSLRYCSSVSGLAQAYVKQASAQVIVNNA